MPITLTNVFHRPNRDDITVDLEKPYFTLWLFLLSFKYFADPTTKLLNNPNDAHPLTLAGLQAQATKDTNYLDIKEIETALAAEGATTLEAGQIALVIKNAQTKFNSVYRNATTDFGALAKTIGFYPVDHGCTGTQAVLDVLEAPVSGPGTYPPAA